MQEVIGEVHHFGETVSSSPQADHRRRTCTGHVACCSARIELAGQRRFAFACDKRAHKNSLQIDRDLLSESKKYGGNERHSQGNRACHLSASALTVGPKVSPVCSVENPLPSIGAARTSRYGSRW